MALHELAGKLALKERLANIPRLMSAYYTRRPDPSAPEQRVEFGTSGHRGSSLKLSFNEDHVLAVSQAICEYRRRQGTNGPLFVGMDTHALSEAAFATAVEVFAANGVELMLPEGLGYTPTPVISRAILVYNRGRTAGLADGVVITPSHNPPEDGGFKYNPPNGGPAGTATTTTIQDRANEILAKKLKNVHRLPYEKALKAPATHRIDFIGPYAADLGSILDLKAVAASGLKIGADPLGGASVAYWEPIARLYGLDITVVNPHVDPTFGFMTVDRDGKIRMDCSSPYAMAGLIGMRERFDIAFGNDPDSDRHGIVTPSTGLLDPNHYLAAAVNYLFQHRPGWRPDAAVGKTVVSSGMIDRVAASLGRRLYEVPVGFKWFVDGLLDGSSGFGGEESAGASFLRLDGSAWTTDKDGIIMNLLAAEITAVTGRDPGQHYRELTARFGSPCSDRIDAPCTPRQKAALRSLSPEMVKGDTLAGEKITARLTHAPGNGAAIGGLKIATANGWCAARPSGTEDTCKIYAESFKGEEHLQAILAEAQVLVGDALQAAGV